MNSTDKALEAAAGEMMIAATLKIERDALISELTRDELLLLARAAIAAFCRNVTVSDRMRSAGDVAAEKHRGDMCFSGIYKAMCAAKADELEAGHG